MLKECLDQVRKKAPVVHNITNYVTVNDVANVILACGGSPIMSDEPEDVADITSICGGLNINLGTLHKTSIEGMLKAGHRSNELGHPELIKEIKFSVIRGNVSEIKTLAYGSGSTKGVDADLTEAVNERNLQQSISFIKGFAKKKEAIVIITGAIDLVTDGEKCYVIRNGRSEMGRITGTGCQLSGITTAFLAANPKRKLEAAVAAVCMMGVAGEIAWTRMQEGDGNATYRNRIIDAIYNMTGEKLEKGAKYELY